MAGRCLLAIEETKLYRKLGLSGAVHYGVRVLKLTKKAAQTLLRVARALEGLPRLSQAAEGGKISWSSLREIVSKATLETEEVWLRLALEKDADEVARLASLTERGRLPWEQPEPDLPTTRMRLNLRPETGELFERAVQSLSRRGGKAVTASEALDHLLQEFFAKRPLDAKASRALGKDLSRGREAARRRQARLIQEAQRIAAGIPSDGADCPLSVALGLLLVRPNLNRVTKSRWGWSLRLCLLFGASKRRRANAVPAGTDRGLPSMVPAGTSEGFPTMVPARTSSGLPSMVPPGTSGVLQAMVPAGTSKGFPMMIPPGTGREFPMLVPAGTGRELPSLQATGDAYRQAEPLWKSPCQK